MSLLSLPRPGLKKILTMERISESDLTFSLPKLKGFNFSILLVCVNTWTSFA